MTYRPPLPWRHLPELSNLPRLLLPANHYLSDSDQLFAKKIMSKGKQDFSICLASKSNLFAGSSSSIQMQPLWVYTSHAKQPEEAGTYICTLRKREFEKGSKVGVYLLAATKNQLSNHRRCFPLLVGCSQAFQTHTREQRLRSDDKNYLTQPSFQECHCLRYVIMINIKSWSILINHCQNWSWLWSI